MTRRTVSRAGWAISALLLCGCGGATTVTGTVTYDGAPVENGVVTFAPADGVGPAVGGRITDGKYRVDDVLPGPKLVKIEAVKRVPFARSSDEMARMAAEAKKRGDGSGLIDSADLIPPNAVGNNAAVEVPRGGATLDFRLSPPNRPAP
jgi:hypothetical protein